MKRTILGLILILVTIVCNADDKVPSLIIATGGNSVDIALDNLISIKYADDTMHINVKEGDNVAIDVEDILSITFRDIEQSSHINNLHDEYSGELHVFDVNGRKMLTATSFDEIQDSNLPKGVYIVKGNNKSRKIVM